MARGTKKSQPQERYIYVIIDGSGATKIGIADDPKQRLIELQVGSSVKLMMSYCIPVPYLQARRIEKQLHSSLKHLRLKGEWFFIDPTVAVKAIYDIIAGPERIEEQKANRWAMELWGTKVTCPQCSHWRVVRQPKKALTGKKFKCGKCGFVHDRR